VVLVIDDVADTPELPGLLAELGALTPRVVLATIPSTVGPP